MTNATIKPIAPPSACHARLFVILEATNQPTMQRIIGKRKTNTAYHSIRGVLLSIATTSPTVAPIVFSARAAILRFDPIKEQTEQPPSVALWHPSHADVRSDSTVAYFPSTAFTVAFVCIFFILSQSNNRCKALHQCRRATHAVYSRTCNTARVSGTFSARIYAVMSNGS